MNIRDLKYFLALLEHRHFGKAAEACFVSQPALSMQIKKLEDYFNVQLVERNGKKVMFTDVGMAIAPKIQNIIVQIEELRVLTESLKNPYHGQLKVGIIPTLAPYFLPYIVQPLSIEFQHLSLYFAEEKTMLAIERLKKGELDCVILALPIAEENCSVQTLFEEKFLLAVPTNHALSKRRLITQAEIANQNLLLLAEGHCLREQALSVCKNITNAKWNNFHATSIETLRFMIANNVGVTLMPELAKKENDGVHYLKFKSPQPSRKIGIIWRKSSAKDILLRGVADFIRKVMGKKLSVIVQAW